MERAFGVLKGRWRISQTPSESKFIINHCCMTAAACVLHNMCTDGNAYYTRPWEVRDGRTEEEQERFTDPEEDDERLRDALRTPGAAQLIQKALCDHMMHNFHLGCVPRSARDD